MFSTNTALSSCRFTAFNALDLIIEANIPMIHVDLSNNLVGLAFDKAVYVHYGEYRVSKDLYTTHLILAVMEYQKFVKEYDPEICAAIFLHDALERMLEIEKLREELQSLPESSDTIEALAKLPVFSLEEIETLFGPNVAFIVNALTIYPGESKDDIAWKLFQASYTHYGVLFAKAADVGSNMKSIGCLPEQRRLNCAIRVAAQYATWLPFWTKRVPEDLRERFVCFWETNINLAKNEIDQVELPDAQEQFQKAIHAAEEDLKQKQRDFPEFFSN